MTATPGAGDARPELDAERWARLEQLFHRARLLEPNERGSFIEHACGSDSSLRRELRELLEHATDSATRLGDAVGEALRSSSGPQVGDQLGAYRLLEVIGQGGLSTVFLAERADRQFEWRVAVKVMRLEVDGGDLADRLRQERQILAGLDHPNIGRLVDGGTTRTGYPYFVMEHIDGADLETHCREHALDLRQRLHLFLQLCEAVAYAHRQLIIHRDLKPANVLITPGGVLKLIDFGIARPEVPGPAAKAATEPGRRPLTLAFASPEQITGQSLSTATDVYSLGVILYRLLSGRPPHPLEEMDRRQVEEAILRREPKRPSRAVQEGWPIRASRLDGDLDTVVLKAMHKDPDRRYASVQQLAADIRRFLEGRAVVARGDSWLYRADRFVRRHRWAVTAAMAVAVFFALYTYRLAVERDRARQEARSKASIADMMVTLFSSARPDSARGEDITARELLDRGAAELRDELRDQPLVRAEMMAVVGRAFAELGLQQKATPLLEEALEIRLGALGESHLDVAASRALLGEHLVDLARFEEAETLFAQALDVRRSRLDKNHRDILATLNDLAVVKVYRGDLEGAERRMREVLEKRRASHPSEHDEIATSLNNLADVLDRQGRGEEAEQIYREALDLKLETSGELSTGVALVLNNLARLAESRGDIERARAHYRRALEVNRRLLSPAHPDILFGFRRLATLAREAGDGGLAERLLGEALGSQRRD
ncbi:MAG: serine/threonine-protein kinase, partial [Acidobacteriota bacterium]